MPAIYTRLKLLVSILFIGIAVSYINPFFKAADAAQSKDAMEFFEKRVRPVLVANCAKCHNPQAQVAELDLTTAEGFARGGLCRMRDRRPFALFRCRRGRGCRHGLDQGRAERA